MSDITAKGHETETLPHSGWKAWQGWVDGHCHLAHPRFTDLLHPAMERSIEAGVTAWVQGGIHPDDWDAQLELRSRYGDGVIPCFGLHPWWVAESTETQVQQGLERLRARLDQARGLGEIGLDKAHGHGADEVKDSLPLQKYAFEEQLKIGGQAEKPLVLHVVRAHGAALEILHKHAPYPAGGLVHAFSGSLEIAREYLELGFVISVGGAVTRDGYQKLKQVLPELPVDRLVVESDAPDQTPRLPGVDPERLNEPANLIGIAEALAGFLCVSRDEVLSRSKSNLKRLFGHGGPGI